MPADGLENDLARLRAPDTPRPEVTAILHALCGTAVRDWFRRQPGPGSAPDLDRLVGWTMSRAARSAAVLRADTPFDLEKRLLELAESVLAGQRRSATIVASLRAAPSREARADHLYRSFGSLVYRYFVRKTAHGRFAGLDPADLTQDTFTTICQNLDRLDLRDGPQLRGWIQTIAARELRAAWRSNCAAARDPARVEHGADPANVPDDVDAVAAREAREEHRDVVELVLELVTPEQADVCRLLLDDLSIDETATALGLTRNAVDSRLKRARWLLAERLLDRIPAPGQRPLVQCLLRGLSLPESAAELRLAIDTVQRRVEDLHETLLDRLPPFIVTFLFHHLGLVRPQHGPEATP